MNAARDLSEFVAAGGDLGARIAAAVPLADDAANTPPPADAVYVQGASTWEMTERGPVRLAPYALRFTRDVTSPTCRTLEGEVRQEGARSVPFSFVAETLGDARVLKKELAKLLGARFRTPRGRLDRMVDAWLESSTVEELAVVHDFGFTDDGTAFFGDAAMLPAGNVRFVPPSEAAASRLRLGDGDAVGVMRELLDLWPRVLGSPTTAAALLGVVGWGLVAPVLEALDPGVSPLLAFLHGASGAGKSTHAGVVQCFFGDFSDSLAAVSFSSTPLSIELEASLFRGAVMVVGDVKAGTIAEGGAAKVLGLVQRAGDRAERRRLDNSGKPLQTQRSRATWLFEGEDVPVSEGSALARLLILPIPESPRQPELMGRLQALMPRLPSATRALVDHLLATKPWPTLVARHRAHAALLTEAAAGAQNGVRLAKSLAAVAVGLEVWASWLATVGLALPADAAALIDALLGPSAAQLVEVADAGPGERFLDLVRQLLASGAARIGEADENGEMIGAWKEDRTVAYLLPAAVLGRIRRHFPDAAATLATPKSILDDLHRIGAAVERDKDRRTKKARVGGGESVNTWAIDAGKLHA